MTDTREMITTDPRGDTMDIGDGEMRTTQSDTTMIVGGETDTLDIVEIIWITDITDTKQRIITVLDTVIIIIIETLIITDITIIETTIIMETTIIIVFLAHKQTRQKWE